MAAQGEPRGTRRAKRAARTGAVASKRGRCHAIVGPTIAGGRHRNDLPRCLHSSRIGGTRPCDRRSDCGALMVPVAHFDRRGGEPVIVHRCLGCGLGRHNRLAADDNLLLSARLPLVAPPAHRSPAPSVEAAHGVDGRAA